MIAISGAFEFTGSDNVDVIVLHQPPNTAFTNGDAMTLKFFGHSFATTGSQTSEHEGYECGPKIPCHHAGVGWPGAMPRRNNRFD